MRVFYLLIKVILFLALFAFAVGNADSIVVRYFPGREWQAPLVFVLLVFFGGGVLSGVVAGTAVIARQRREILALRRALRRARESIAGAA